MGPEQILAAAIAVAVVILVIFGIVRASQRRVDRNTEVFGAGGRTTVAVGAEGFATTALEPTGVVRVVGEPWSARSADGATIPVGTAVRVTALDGLVLVVEAVPGASSGAAPSQH